MPPTMIRTPTSRMMDLYKRLTFSSDPDPRLGHPVLALLETNLSAQGAFNAFIRSVVWRLRKTESVDVHWWTSGLLYVSVSDRRFKHYPCNMRYLVSFDIFTGRINNPDSPNGYCFARKGWGEFADEHSGGREVYRHTQCEFPDNPDRCP